MSLRFLIQELVKFWRDKRGENWTRRQKGEEKITEESAHSRSAAGVRLRNIIVDFLIVAMSSVLVFYLALQSVSGAQYAGTGFQQGSQSLVSAVLLVIFALGVCRLVVDLRSRCNERNERA